jgi:Epoxide hydrolase N terminus
MVIEPFRIAVPDAQLDELASRLRATRLDPDPVDDWEEGINTAYLAQLIAYWRDRYDWRAQERPRSIASVSSAPMSTARRFTSYMKEVGVLRRCRLSSLTVFRIRSIASAS